jgi:hypothetical protein
MEEKTQSETGQQEQHQKSKAKPVILAVLASILIVGAGAGVFFWQHGKVNDLNSRVSHLQSELNAADKSGSPTKKQSATPDTFSYSPKTGGLSLTLPKTYGIIVNVDGNKGGAPGATFRVASVTNSNTFSDPSYQSVQVDVDNTFTTLDHAVSSEEAKLDEQRGSGSTVNRNYKVSDTTVAGLPAKLLTADGLDEYQGQVTVYLVGSGSFTYTITANGTQSGNPAALTVLLKGISIKPVTL